MSRIYGFVVDTNTRVSDAPRWISEFEIIVALEDDLEITLPDDFLDGLTVVSHIIEKIKEAH